MPVALESNIWKYTILQVTNKRVFVAILGAYYLTIPGVTTFWIGIFLLAGNGAKFMFDIPSSYLADKIGHKDALVLSRVSMLISTILFLLATNITGLILASVCLSIGFAFMSGVGSAFMHETMRSLGRTSEYTAVMGKSSSIGFFIPAVMAAVVPFFVSVNYQIPFLIGLVLDLVGLVATISLVRPTVSPERVAEMNGTSFREVVRQGLALRFFRIAIFSGVVSTLITGVDSFRGPYQIFLAIPVVWFGIFFGAGRVLASVMLAYSGKIREMVGDVYAYQRLQIIVFGILFLCIGFISTPWVVVAVFILTNGLKFGMSQIDTGYLLDIIRDNKFKATLLSMSSQLESIFTMGIVVAMGAAITAFGFQQSYAALAGLFFLIVIPLHLWMYRNRSTHAAK